MNENTLIISMLGLLIAGLQALHFFIMSDIRDRLVRLERNYFEQWDKQTERRGV